MRVLDRLAGPNPLRLVVVDPRPTPVAREATVHLAIKSGTNVALLDAFLHEILENGLYDEGYVEAHTIGFDELRRTVAECTPEWAPEVCGVEADEIRDAARILGESERLLSTVLQGVYQSHQATAAACQINNLHLLRGMIGRPDCGFRNWDNKEHVQKLADLWNVDSIKIPHWAPPTHAISRNGGRGMRQCTLRTTWGTCTRRSSISPTLSATWERDTLRSRTSTTPATLWRSSARRTPGSSARS
jgi:ferredoxin-nitrate reductase